MYVLHNYGLVGHVIFVGDVGWSVVYGYGGKDVYATGGTRHDR